MKHILLAEDDMDLGASLSSYLNSEGYEVSLARDGEEALKLSKTKAFNLFVLDVMMPKMDGFELAKKLVDIHPETPFLFLTARKTNEDIIKGLKMGADDYISKPFEVDQLMLRIHNIIKRTEQSGKLKLEAYKNQEIHIGAYRFQVDSLHLIGPSMQKTLTEKEAQLLLFLNEYRGQLIPREDILKKVWTNTDFFSGRSMDVFISRLRKYLKEDPSIELKSIRGVGLEFHVNT